MIRRMAISAPVNRRPNVPLIILGAVLALLGFVSVVLLGQGSQAPAAAGIGTTTTVVVAAHNITGRTVLSRSDLTTAQISPIPGAVSKVDDAVGMVAQVDVKQGQPLLSSMLAKTDTASGSPSAYLPLPKGFVAFTLPTSEQLGVAGYIQNGDYIDIVAVVTHAGGSSVVRTIYSSVHVIRVGAAPAEQTGAGAPPIQRGGTSATITVAVSECQAEYLTWFIANAQLRYTLLSYQDNQPDSANPDTSCPGASGSAKGITDGDVRSRWPGLL